MKTLKGHSTAFWCGARGATCCDTAQEGGWTPEVKHTIPCQHLTWRGRPKAGKPSRGELPALLLLATILRLIIPIACQQCSFSTRHVHCKEGKAACMDCNDYCMQGRRWARI